MDELIRFVYVQDEVFCFCRFSVSNDMNQVVYIAAVTGENQTRSHSSSF